MTQVTNEDARERNTIMKTLHTINMFLIVTILAFATTAAAQSAFFNIPTSEVMPKGETYVEFDYDAKLSPFRRGGWQSFGVVIVRGIGRKAEVGVNAYLARSEEGFEPVELQPNFKYQVHNSEDHGTTLSVGAIGYIPLKRRIGSGSFASVYVVGGKKFRSDWAPRLTAGAYQFFGAKRDSGDTRGLLFAVEQPVHKRVSLIADWNSGRNRLGYAAAGFSATLTKRSAIYSAYYFGNEGSGNNFLGVYYSWSF